VALNRECPAGRRRLLGLLSSSPQVRWPEADLATHHAMWTLATFHRPYFSDMGGTVTKVKQPFTALYKGGADVLLVGHQHICERFRLQNSSGPAAANGIRQFIVGPAQEHDRPRLPCADRVGPEAGKTFTDTAPRPATDLARDDPTYAGRGSRCGRRSSSWSSSSWPRPRRRATCSQEPASTEVIRASITRLV
jgi:hypothetical protein